MEWVKILLDPTIFNDDAVNATGEITIRLTNDISKRFSR